MFFKKADQDIQSVDSFIGGGNNQAIILDEEDDDDDISHHEAVRTSYHKGGSQYKALVDPTKLQDESDEDCEEIYTDLSSGDELCWMGEASLSPTAQLQQLKKEGTAVRQKNTAVPLHARIETKSPKTPVSKSYQKGGSRQQPVVNPTKLEDDSEEDCDGEPYVDFATGDELCWSI